MVSLQNPFRPGAGHMPPFLAGRENEIKEFKKLLLQTTILENLVLTGLRGVGKTVLLETLKPIASQSGWLWAGGDMSESVSINEENMAIRIITDLSIHTSNIVIQTKTKQQLGFSGETESSQLTLNYHVLKNTYDSTPGLNADKLKATLELAWKVIENSKPKGMVFAYDEAQNLADHANKDQYPLSLILDVFQSIQRKGIPFMLALTGLPTLSPKLVESRTYAERMFRIIFLHSLNDEQACQAITKPIDDDNCSVKFSEESVSTIVEVSGGYPYFIQFICKEVFDVFIQKIDDGNNPSVPIEEIERKLDTDFFQGRWSRATDRSE